jgi:photosystem II stability/assembly factor-like uncharacterized protein
MSTARRLFFLALVWNAGWLAAAAPQHDLYLTANVSGQGSVMGRGGVALSGLYRSSDRTNFEHLGPQHIRMFRVASDPAERDALYVAALDGVLRTRDGGKTWRTLTGWDMTEPKDIAFDPHAPGRIYAGLPDGIALSTDHGQTWRRSNDGIRRAYTNAIVVDRSAAGRILAGTELGIYLSEDGAVTWRLVQPTIRVTYHLKQSPHDPRVFLAATSGDGALRSADGGRTWSRMAGISQANTLHYADFDAQDAQRLLVCGWNTGLQLSEDGGQSWTDRAAGLPNRDVWSAAFDPDVPGRIFAAPNQAPLHVSDDRGRTWRPVQFDKATVFNLVFLPRP